MITRVTVNSPHLHVIIRELTKLIRERLELPGGSFTWRLGRLSDERMRQVCTALAVAVDCRS